MQNPPGVKDDPSTPLCNIDHTLQEIFNIQVLRTKAFGTFKNTEKHNVDTLYISNERKDCNN